MNEVIATIVAVLVIILAVFAGHEIAQEQVVDACNKYGAYQFKVTRTYRLACEIKP